MRSLDWRPEDLAGSAIRAAEPSGGGKVGAGSRGKEGAAAAGGLCGSGGGVRKGGGAARFRDN